MDEDLIRAAKAGDELAGAWLVSLHGPLMLGYCHSIAPELSDVDRELICERAVEKALRKIDEFDPERGSLPSWLRGFVKYSVLSWRRAEGIRAAEPVDEMGLPCPPPDLAPHDPRIARLAAAVRALAPDQQLLVALRYRENLPSSEIADRLRLSDDAVRQRLSRLRRLLAVQIEGESDAGLNGAA